MKRYFSYLFVIAMLFAISCSDNMEKGDEKKGEIVEIIGKPELNLKSDIMTPEVLWAFGRLGAVELSPDKKTILFGITYYNIEQNKGNTELYTMPATGGEMTKITNTPFGEYNAMWTPGGQKISFMTAESGSMQIWEMNADGTERMQITYLEGGITGFKYSPDSKKILYTKEVDLVQHVVDIYADLPKADARIIDDLMYRHWDSFTDSYSHIFVADYDGVQISNSIDIMEGEEFDSPLKPFGGMEEINWSPDASTIAYTCVKKKGLEYSLSTNSDIYLFDIKSKSTKNITEGMLGYDKAPVFSPDGKKIAFTSMERDGYESDKNRLFIFDINNNQKTYLTDKFDQNVGSLAWDGNENLFFISDYHARFQIYKINANTQEIKTITEGNHNFHSAIPTGKSLIATKQSMSAPTEIISVDIESGKETQLSFINKDILDKLALAKVEERWIKTTDNKDMLVWVIYPPHFDPNKKYPAILYCQGGPQSSVSQFFSYRWNFQLMAANGYIVVAPNRRGVPSFGQAWNEQISGDYGGQNMKDYLSAIDALAKEPFVDETRLGAVGASYGGFSVYWLAGNHNKRFKAFIAHDGMFNLESQYLETEEMWFANWDLGGAFWDKTNTIAQKSYANSPHKFVDKWDTPILVIHGEKDYRIASTQGMSAFNAAKLRGVPARFLYFPEENHWVLAPQNGILWQRVFKDWLDKYLK